MKVYLAGGMHGNWRETVKHECRKLKNVEFFDPTSHGFDSGQPKEYTAWDLFKIKDCDIVFAYMNTENPSGYGLNLELGYAKGLGKTIVFVDTIHDWRDEYFGMARSVADIRCKYLIDGINTLKDFIK